LQGVTRFAPVFVNYVFLTQGRKTGDGRFDFIKAAENPLHVYTNSLYIRAMRGQAKTVSDALFGIAEGQQGYFQCRIGIGEGFAK
jgi:hypothetical protein